MEQQRYPVDDITIPITCELHVGVKNISVHVAHESALPENPASTIHGMPIPSSYASITVEQIVEPTHINENLELDFVGGDGEKTLGDALHGIVLWRKADIKLIANNNAPVNPPPSAPSPLEMLIAIQLPQHRLRLSRGPVVLQLLRHQKKKERIRHHPSHCLDPQTRSRKGSKRR